MKANRKNIFLIVLGTTFFYLILLFLFLIYINSGLIWFEDNPRIKEVSIYLLMVAIILTTGFVIKVKEKRLIFFSAIFALVLALLSPSLIRGIHTIPEYIKGINSPSYSNEIGVIDNLFKDESTYSLYKDESIKYSKEKRGLAIIINKNNKQLTKDDPEKIKEIIPYGNVIINAIDNYGNSLRMKINGDDEIVDCTPEEICDFT